MSTVNQAKNTARDAANEARPWVVFLARLGWAAKGIVYAVIGILAFQAAIGTGSPNINPQDALNHIATQPFGRVLLWVVAIGLIGYVIWDIVRAVMDPEHDGDDTKGLVKRGSYIVSAIGYAIIDFTAFQILLQHRSASGGGGQIRDWTAKVMSFPAGRWIIGLVGLIIIAVGVIQFVTAYKEDFMKSLMVGKMNETEIETARRTGQIGLSARGVVYLVIGVFLLEAAITYNPSKAGGLGDALAALARQPYGPYLLGLVALGLIVYGVYALLLSRYRRIYIPAA